MKRLLSLAVLLLFTSASWAAGAHGGELRFAIRAEPKTFDPLLVADEASETVRYLTAGVLLRLNRRTQELEPELAESWETRDGGRKMVIRLRQGVRFSDGTPFSAQDVGFTLNRLLDPELRSPLGDSIRPREGEVEVEQTGPHELEITFPAPVAGLARLFDRVAILPSGDNREAVLGPFQLTEHEPGSHLLLERNPHYWKRDSQGRQLPYLDAVRLVVQQNRQSEALRFRRGEYHLIDRLEPDLFEQLERAQPEAAYDAGASLNSELLWFNQTPAAPIESHKKAWFTSQNFRRAVSSAIKRNDLCRIVYRSRAEPAAGPVSPANRYWVNNELKPHSFDAEAALSLLADDGFRLEDSVLKDAKGNAVEFSLITNSGNRARERMAAMIQQDLKQIGIQLNVVTLDFPSLIERIAKTYDYDACLLGLVNGDLDPNAQMSIWLSSARNHQWNPSQAEPATAWEAEMDELMRGQAAASDPVRRKELFDRVQEIVWEQAPMIYLLHPNALSAVAPVVSNAAPAALGPQTFWNIEKLSLGATVRSESE